MSNLAGQRIKDTYDGVLHASGSSLTLGNGNSTDTINANFNTVDVPVGGLKEGGISHASVSATTSVVGHVELATNAEAHAATDTTRAVTPSNLLIKKDGTAFVAGDFSGNSRGSSALDFQSGRSGSTPVASGSEAVAVGFGNTASNTRSITFGFENTASAGGGIGIGYQNTTSGNYGSSAFGYKNQATGFTSTAMGAYNIASGFSRSSAVGYSNTASGDLGSAFGYNNTASGDYSISFGYNNTASGKSSSAVGYNNTASGSYSSAFGYINVASGRSSSAFGYRAKTTVDYTFEIGRWAIVGGRRSAIRMHPNGQVAMTIEDSASAPTDGGATAGSEADGTLARGMFAIQKNGTAVTLYYNNGGTIQSLSLGTLS
jgi:hypothetical protein